MSEIKLYTGDIVASFSKLSHYKTYNRITWNSKELSSVNALVTTFKVDVTFVISNFYKILSLYKLYEFFIVFVIPDTKEFIYNDYYTVFEHKKHGEISLNISVITLSIYLNKMIQDRGIKVENCTLVIFRELNWCDIVKPLANERLEVTGGFSSKRHISSTLSHKHHAYILAMFNLDLVGFPR